MYIVSVAPLATSACACRIDPFTFETHVLLLLSALFSISTTTQPSTAIEFNTWTGSHVIDIAFTYGIDGGNRVSKQDLG